MRYTPSDEPQPSSNLIQHNSGYDFCFGELTNPTFTVGGREYTIAEAFHYTRQNTFEVKFTTTVDFAPLLDTVFEIHGTRFAVRHRFHRNTRGRILQWERAEWNVPTEVVQYSPLESQSIVLDMTVGTREGWPQYDPPHPHPSLSTNTREKGYSRRSCIGYTPLPEAPSSSSLIQHRSRYDYCFGELANPTFTVGGREYTIAEAFHYTTQNTFEVKFTRTVDFAPLQDTVFEIHGTRFAVRHRFHRHHTRGRKVQWKLAEWNVPTEVVQYPPLESQSTEEAESQSTEEAYALQEGPQYIDVALHDEANYPFPTMHDGSSLVEFRIAFSTDPESLSYRTIRDRTVVARQSGQTLKPVVHRRIDRPSNRVWALAFRPVSNDDMTIEIRGSESCSDDHAVCADGAPLRSEFSRVVKGPPGFTVHNTQAAEGGALMFLVTLQPAVTTQDVTVNYATSAGTATSGVDYTDTSGILTFAPGDTMMVVSVDTIDDSVDDGGETVIVTLDSPSHGLPIDRATATGTINNSDPMPQAWLARFGRTVAEQAIEAVEGRFAANRAAGVEMTLAGQRIGAAGAAPEDAAARKTLAGEEEARSRLAAMTTWLRGTEAAAGDAGDGRAGYRSRTVTPRDLVLGSSFSLTGEAKAGGLVSLWGRGAVSRFDGRAGDLSLDGEVKSLMMGADWASDPGSGSGAGRWTAGLLMSRSVGEGGYREPGADPASVSGMGGTVRSTLTGLFPYGRYAVSDRVALWGIAGFGEGDLTLTPEPAPDADPRDADPGTGSAIRTGMDLAMGAVGLRGVAVEAPAEGGVELAVKTDAMAVRTTSEKTRGMAAAEADVTRLRLALEGTWRGLTLGTGTLAPSGEIGVRQDGGDAETGFGLDLGGGLAWSDPESGLTAEFRGRGLLTHESKGFRDRSLSGSFSWAPGQGSGRGPTLTLTQTLGASASGGADALLGQRHLGGLAANDNGAGGDDLENRRLELRFGYGFSAIGDRFTMTPELGLGLSNGHREYTLGWRFGLVAGGTNALELRVEGTRRETANDDTDPEHGVGFRATARW